MMGRNSSIVPLVPVVALILRLASAPTANLSYMVIMLYALFGRAQAVQALFLSWFFGMVSPGIAPDASAQSVGRYGVMAAAAVSVLLRSGTFLGAMRVSRSVSSTLCLGGIFIIHSLLFSPIVDVSALKALSWTIVTTTLLAAWSGLPSIERRLLSRQVFGGLLVLLICSLPLLALPLGFLRNGTGFQGVLNHPQAFGLTVGLIAAWAGSTILTAPRPTWWLIATFATCLILMVLSEARTAGIATLLAIALAVMVGNISSGIPFKALLSGLSSIRVHLVIVLGLMAAILASSALSDRLNQYITKRTSAANLAEAYDASRGQSINQMWSNIQKNPWVGIGFGIASYPEDMVVDRDPVLGLPTGAAIEKGVLPIAVLEEVGILGLLAVILWLWMMVRRALHGGGITALAVFIVALLMNMGENVLFSPGGLGLLFLILMTWAITERTEAKGRGANE